MEDSMKKELLKQYEAGKTIQELKKETGFAYGTIQDVFFQAKKTPSAFKKRKEALSEKKESGKWKFEEIN